MVELKFPERIKEKFKLLDCIILVAQASKALILGGICIGLTKEEALKTNMKTIRETVEKFEKLI